MYPRLCIRALPTIDFTQPCDGLTDVVLEVEGQQLHVGKQVSRREEEKAQIPPPLGVLQSALLRQLQGEGGGRDPLKEVPLDTFLVLLHIVHNSNIEIKRALGETKAHSQQCGVAAGIGGPLLPPDGHAPH